MTLLFCDSVQGYTDATGMEYKWTAVSSDITVSSTAGRDSTPMIRINSTVDSSWQRYLYKTLDASHATLIVGFRMKFPTATSARPVLGFLDGTTYQCCLVRNSNGSLQAYSGNGSGSSLGAESASRMSADTLYYVQVKVTFDNSSPPTGTFQVKVTPAGSSTTDWLDLTGVATQSSANATANQIRLSNKSGYIYYQDVYVCNTSGSYNNDFLGDVYVDALLPSGAGVNTNLTPSAGSNYECIDDTNPTVSDYVYGTTDDDGTGDSYTFTDLAASSPDILAVVNNLFMLKTDTGTIYAKSLVITDPTDSTPVEYVGSNITPATSWSTKQYPHETNPATSIKWLEAEINAAEFGFQISTS